MTNIPDKTLIRRVKKDGCNDSFLELCRRYENVFYKMCHKFTPALINSGISPTDIFNEKNIIIFNCIKTYDPKRGAKLSTHICNYARFLCLNSITKRKCLISVDTDEMREMLDNADSMHGSREKEENKETYDFLKNLLSQMKDKRIPQIIEMRHLSPEKKEWKQIAEKMNISSQTVINLHERGMNFLRTKLRSTDFADIV
jgi:RNA polymerase sigma factor (sigma-70 family)